MGMPTWPSAFPDRRSAELKEIESGLPADHANRFVDQHDLRAALFLIL
jgi:hypothetical protein